MRIVRTGRRDAEEAILFLNPMCADTTFWKNIVSDRLASAYEILMVDYPGYNSAFVSQASLSDVAESVKREILDGMDIEDEQRAAGLDVLALFRAVEDFPEEPQQVESTHEIMGYEK